MLSPVVLFVQSEISVNEKADEVSMKGGGERSYSILLTEEVDEEEEMFTC